MALGSNLIAKGRHHLAARMFKFLGFKPMKLAMSRGELRIFAKAGIPVSNTAADSPERVAFIIDTTNQDVYFVHTWVSSSSFTVVKVSN